MTFFILRKAYLEYKPNYRIMEEKLYEMETQKL